MAKMLPLGPLHVAQILMGLQCIKKVLGRESPFKHNNNNNPWGGQNGPLASILEIFGPKTLFAK